LAFLGRSKRFHGPWTPLAQLLFPSWKFFSHLSYVPTILVRFDYGDETQWVPLDYPESKRSLKTLFLNPRGNLILYFQSLLDRLVNDIQANDIQTSDVHHPDLPSGNILHNPTYKMVERLVLNLSLEKHSSFRAVQFKLVIREFDVLISDWVEE
jgi:hypothetical protein